MAIGLAAALMLCTAPACGGGGSEGGGYTGASGPPPADVQGSSHSLGRQDAPVIVVEYADFQ